MQGLWNQCLIWGWTLFWQEKSGSSSQTCVSCFSGFQSMLIFRPNFPFPSKAHQCPTTGTGESWPNETLLGPYPVPAYASPDSRRSRIKLQHYGHHHGFYFVGAPCQHFSSYEIPWIPRSMVLRNIQLLWPKSLTVPVWLECLCHTEGQAGFNSEAVQVLRGDVGT